MEEYIGFFSGAFSETESDILFNDKRTFPTGTKILILKNDPSYKSVPFNPKAKPSFLDERPVFATEIPTSAKAVYATAGGQNFEYKGVEGLNPKKRIGKWRKEGDQERSNVYDGYAWNAHYFQRNFKKHQRDYIDKLKKLQEKTKREESASAKEGETTVFSAIIVNKSN